jgi:ABC-2 type transport system permease protein
MRNIGAVFTKQLKETLKNKSILIQFLMFPMMTVIMESAMNIEGMPDHFFVNMFATMYIGMAPLVSISSIIAEEKEKNTLRVLHMANVKAGEYLLGNAIYI